MSHKVSSINTIEVSAVCDNRCSYCPAPTQHEHRAVGLMTLDMFKRAAFWVKYFADRGTQRELNLHGVGEPTLNHQLVEMVRVAREAAPDIVINFNTNGNNLTPELAAECKAAGLTSINVTAHDALSTKNAVKAIRAAGLEGHVNADFAVNPNNWGGQVAWTETVDYKLWCRWLDEGQVMVTWDGQITRCCLDAFGQGVFATVDDNISDMEVTPFVLCTNCHHERPAI